MLWLESSKARCARATSPRSNVLRRACTALHQPLSTTKHREKSRHNSLVFETDHNLAERELVSQSGHFPTRAQVVLCCFAHWMGHTASTFASLTATLLARQVLFRDFMQDVTCQCSSSRYLELLSKRAFTEQTFTKGSQADYSPHPVQKRNITIPWKYQKC